MHETVSEREAYLFNPDRMELRFRHFETLTLPSIKGQKDPRFTFLILVGTSLPKIYRDRLHDITAAIPQVKIIAKPSMRQRRAAKETIKAALGDDKTESIQWRLDDDDAVSVNFVRSIRWFAKHTAGMRRNWRNIAFEYNSGFSVSLSERGIAAEEVHARFWACGLAVLFRPGDKKTVMNYPHHKLHTHMPTFINPHPHMFLRAKHGDNDSAKTDDADEFMPLSEKQVAYFRKTFNVDEDHVRRVFSGSKSLLDKA